MHQGNTMAFGPDGKIYFAMGDDSLNTNSQDLSTIFGKILRINPDGTIPQDNPFYNTPGAPGDLRIGHAQSVPDDIHRNRSAVGGRRR